MKRQARESGTSRSSLHYLPELAPAADLAIERRVPSDYVACHVGFDSAFLRRLEPMEANRAGVFAANLWSVIAGFHFGKR